jgi:hypothetical protein
VGGDADRVTIVSAQYIGALLSINKERINRLTLLKEPTALLITSTHDTGVPCLITATLVGGPQEAWNRTATIDTEGVGRALVIIRTGVELRRGAPAVPSVTARATETVLIGRAAQPKLHPARLYHGIIEAINKGVGALFTIRKDQEEV